MTETPRNVFDLAARERKAPQAYSVAIPASLKEDLNEFYWDTLSHKRFIPGNAMSFDKKGKVADSFWRDLHNPCTPQSLVRMQAVVESVRNDYRKEYDIAAAELADVREKMHRTNVRDMMEWQCNGQSPLTAAKEKLATYKTVTHRIERILDTIPTLVPKLENPFGYAILPPSLFSNIQSLYDDLSKDETAHLDEKMMERLGDYTLDSQKHLPLNDLKHIISTIQDTLEQKQANAFSNVEQFTRLANGENFRNKDRSMKSTGTVSSGYGNSEIGLTRDILDSLDKLFIAQPRATVQAHPTLKAGGPV
ncbi:hypothetical protein [Micavibrio aeruginosavorus]|uniref:hypothetical protein n=1 Tax=Micavibrio aeruginosavorus TaxID=349221 RepID=UPI003F4AD4E1